MRDADLPDPLFRLRRANREEIYRELRENMPVYWSAFHSAWVLTRYADVFALLRDPRAEALQPLPFLQSLTLRGGLDLSYLIEFTSSLSLFTRPPRHTAIRKLLVQALGGIRQLNLTGLLEDRAERLLREAASQGSIDLAEGYGRALTLFLICRFLGIPEEDVPALSRLAADFMAVFERQVPSVRTLLALNNDARRLMDYFGRLIAAKRKSPGDDGISLIVALADGELACSDTELAGYCTFFFIAAEETTGSAISSAALMLLERPDLRALLARQPGRLAQAIPEFLRLASPVHYIARQAGADFTIAGQSIPAGDAIMLMLGSANRDPMIFPDPDSIVLDRSGPEALVFAAGPYRCLGAQLATLEVEVAVRKLLQVPGLRLSEEPPIWTERMNIAPLRRLEAKFT